MRLSIEIKFVNDARPHRLMMLPEIEEKTIWSSRKHMDDGVGIIFLQQTHMIGHLFSERSGVFAACHAPLTRSSRNLA